MSTIKPGDFSSTLAPRKVTLIAIGGPYAHYSDHVRHRQRRSCPLRKLGILACWYLMHDGEPVSGPLTSLSAAEQQAATFRLRA